MNHNWARSFVKFALLVLVAVIVLLAALAALLIWNPVLLSQMIRYGLAAFCVVMVLTMVGSFCFQLIREIFAKHGFEH